MNAIRLYPGVRQEKGTGLFPSSEQTRLIIGCPQNAEASVVSLHLFTVYSPSTHPTWRPSGVGRKDKNTWKPPSSTSDVMIARWTECTRLEVKGKLVSDSSNIVISIVVKHPASRVMHTAPANGRHAVVRATRTRVQLMHIARRWQRHLNICVHTTWRKEEGRYVTSDR